MVESFKHSLSIEGITSKQQILQVITGKTNCVQAQHIIMMSGAQALDVTISTSSSPSSLAVVALLFDGFNTCCEGLTEASKQASNGRMDVVKLEQGCNS